MGSITCSARRSDYRANELPMGAMDDEAKLVTRFLGRPPSAAAYKAFLLE